MKRTALLLAGLAIVSATLFAAPVKTQVTTEAAKPTNQTSNQTTMGGVFTLTGGKIEFMSSLFKSSSTKTSFDGKEIGKTESSGFLWVEDSTLTDSQKKKSGFEPYSISEIGGELFNSVDVKLVVKDINENYKKCEEHFDQGRDQRSELWISKEWDNTYLEWMSKINFANTNGTLFQALTSDVWIKSRKKVGITEGQVKIIMKNGNTFSIDGSSQDTYIKIAPENLELYFRPYDIFWAIGDEFKNRDFDKSYSNSLDTINSDLFSTSYMSAENPTPGVEVAYTAGTLKLFGALNLKTAGETKKTTSSSGVTTVKTTPLTPAPSNKIKLGIEIKPDLKTKLVVASLIGMSNTNDKTDTSGATSGNTTNKNEVSYFALNVDGETTLDMGNSSNLKLEAEMDMISEGDNVSSETSANGTALTYSSTKTTLSKLGLFFKGSTDIKGFMAPYASLKIINSSDKREGRATLAATTDTTKETKLGEMNIAVGADKKIDAVTLNAEFGIVTGTFEDVKAKTKTENFGTQVSMKATYEF